MFGVNIKRMWIYFWNVIDDAFFKEDDGALGSGAPGSRGVH